MVFFSRRRPREKKKGEERHEGLTFLSISGDRQGGGKKCLPIGKEHHHGRRNLRLRGQHLRFQVGEKKGREQD